MFLPFEVLEILQFYNMTHSNNHNPNNFKTCSVGISMDQATAVPGETLEMFDMCTSKSV